MICVGLYLNEEQRKEAEKVKAELNGSELYKNKIVTQIVPFTNFYQAEDYHQNYYEKNPTAGYCTVVIDPKIQKLYKLFKDQTKD